jgi:hypothetical protein
MADAAGRVVEAVPSDTDGRFHALTLAAGKYRLMFPPEDEQNNTASPFFGTFYNAGPRRLRLQFRFER